MGQQRLRDLELKEKKREEQQKESPEKEKKPETAQASAKKWKGKDWFAIFSPKVFGEKVIGETPATNPKTIIGRNIDVSIPELTGQRGKDFYRIMLAIDRLEGRNAYTRFNGYVTLKEHVMRVVRKRTQKIESIMNVRTKDGWGLHINSVAILNRNTEITVRKKVRAHIEKAMEDMVSKSGIDDFVNSIVNARLQIVIKKSGTKIYPVRFFEIVRVQVTGVPKAKA